SRAASRSSSTSAAAEAADTVMAMSPASAQFEHLGMLEADQRIHQLAFAPFGLGLTLLGQGVERLAGTRAKQALQVLQRNTLLIQGAPFGVVFGRRGGRH